MTPEYMFAYWTYREKLDCVKECKDICLCYLSDAASSALQHTDQLDIGEIDYDELGYGD